MNIRLFLLLFLFPLIAAAQTGTPPADPIETEWQSVLALEAGPKQLDVKNPEQARSATLAHLAKQETALRGFLARHPDSAHVVDAQLQLAHLLATRSDFNGNTAEFEAALRLLTEAQKTASQERRVDFDFARIALSMRRMTTTADQDREALISQVYAFKASYPSDRRVAALLAEIATLYDTQPQRKRELLNEALAAATTPELRARIEDDIKRLSFLGRPLDIRGVTLGGAPFDISQCRGKVTLIYFFATWSPPSVVALEEVESVRNTFAKDPVQVIGVSLDSSREALEAALKSRNITWPVLFDGKSWKSPLVRSLSINAIPTLWLVDRQGNLRTLTARVQTAALVQVLLKEK